VTHIGSHAHVHTQERLEAAENVPSLAASDPAEEQPPRCGLVAGTWTEPLTPSAIREELASVSVSAAKYGLRLQTPEQRGEALAARLGCLCATGAKELAGEVRNLQGLKR
jgi:hypothetical protein